MADQHPEVKIVIKKKKGGHAAGHSGGAWKVAYADLVTAMMAFFLLMWLLSSASSSVKKSLAMHFSEGPGFWDTTAGKEMITAHNKGILPGGRGMSPTPGDGEPDPDAAVKERAAMEETAAAIEKSFRDDKLLQAFQDQISMDFTDEGLRIQVQDKAAQVLFDSGSARVKPYTLSILKEIAQELGKLPNHVVIGGHTDSQRYASQAYTNWELSSERANAARRVLESSGLRGDQVRRTTGYSDTIPLEGHDPKDSQNRRISIVVLSSATELAEVSRQKSKGTRTPKAAS
ncbi:MAG: flagellar motor protein MotB [Holophaga sp.]|nr:flagellar motor protein MotB [Holophaga sp.]